MIPIRNLDLGHLLLLDHGLPHVLVLVAHLVNLLGWMGQENHSKTFYFYHFIRKALYACKLLVVVDGIG